MTGVAVAEIRLIKGDQLMSRRQYAFTLAMVIISAVVSTLISSGMVAAKSSQSQPATVQTPGGVPKWEYQIVFGGPKNGGYAISELNRLSEQGYEVAGYSTTADESGRQSFSVLLRRARP
jgi:hypothetical protein